jgi:hypothetical protein
MAMAYQTEPRLVPALYFAAARNTMRILRSGVSLKNGSCSALRRTARFASTTCEWRHEVLSTVRRSLGIQRTIPVRPRDDARVGLRERCMPSQAISCPACGCAPNPDGEGSHPNGQGRRCPRVRHGHESEVAYRQEPKAKRFVTLRRDRHRSRSVRRRSAIRRLALPSTPR